MNRKKLIMDCSAAWKTRRCGTCHHRSLCASLSVRIAFLAAICSSSAAVRAADPVPTAEELKAKCPPAAEQLEAAYRQIRGKGAFLIKNVYRNPTGSQRGYDVEFAFDGKSSRIVEKITKYTFREAELHLGKTYVSVVSPKFCFQLQRKPRAAEFTTDYMSQGNDQAYKKIASTIESHHQMFATPYRIAKWLPVAQLIRHPSFVAKKISTAENGGVAEVRVEFDVSPTSEKTDPLHTWFGAKPLSGWFVVCPSCSWALHEYEFHSREQNNPAHHLKQYGVVRYGSIVDGIPLLSHVENVTSINGEVATFEQLHLTEVERGPSPAEDFTPAAFNVGGSVSVPVPGRSLSPTYWFVLCAAVAGLAAIGLRLLARSRGG